MRFRGVIALLLTAAWPVLPVQAALQLADADSSPPPIISLPAGDNGATASGVSSPSVNGMLDLLQKMQDLKQRIESLQNQIEIQNHEIQQLQSQQRDFFGAMDSRLSALQQAPPAQPAPAASPAPAAEASGAANPGAASPSPRAQKEYDHAFSLLRAGHYNRAVSAFQAFLKRAPHSALAGSAHYWLAETYYVLGEYRRSLPEFRAVVAHYPNSDRIPDTLYKIGAIEKQLGLPKKAAASWRTLIRKYPHSPSATLARKRLRSLEHH